MARYRTPVYAPPPKYMQHQTDIRAPSVRTHWVDGRAKYTFIPPEIGPIRILDSDDEDETKPVIIRAKTPHIKREHLDGPSRTLGRGHSQKNHPLIKREPSAKNLERHHSQRFPLSPAGVDRPRQSHNSVQSHVGFNGSQLRASFDNASLSSSATVSSSPGFEFDDSSSSSSDDADSDVYKPSTPPSKISSTSPRTRQQTAREATTKPEPERASREPAVAKEVEGSEHAPLEFYIDLPVRPGQLQTGKANPSISPRSSSQGVSSSQVTQRAHSRSRPLSHNSTPKVSPKVLGFLPINREKPPANAPTEPRAMRTANTIPGSSTGLALNRRPQHSIESVKAPSRFGLHGLPPAGVRPLGSTRPELCVQQANRDVSRAAKSDSIALRLMSQPQARPGFLSSQSRPRMPAEPSAQSSIASSSLSGPPQGQLGDAVPDPSNSRPPHQARQTTSGKDKGPAPEIVQPSGGLPNSSPRGQANTPRRSESVFPSPGQIGNKVNDRRRHDYQRRRGPARPGRTMQSVEHPGMGLSLSPPTLPVHNAYPPPYRPATPGPSCPSRAAPTHPESSPGLFVTPHTPFHTRPFASSPTRSAVSRGKRPHDEAEDLDPAVRRAEWERMMERMRNHEVEMEQTRGRLERTNNMLEDQQRRIEELEQQRRIDDLLKELDGQDPFEGRQVHAKDDVQPYHAGAQQSHESVQPERRQEQRHRHGGHRQHDRSVEPEQPEARQREPEIRHPQQHNERQQAAGQRRRAIGSPSPAERNGVDSVTRAQSIIENIQRPNPAALEARKLTQRRFRHEVLEHALSGHNPKLVFDDDDRPIVSEATAFLLRLSQQEVLDKFSRYIKHKEFFDVSHPSFKSMGCWVISGEASSDYKMKLWDKGEKHTFSFTRLAIRLWHEEESMYRLLQGKTQQKAIPVCHNEQCMNPGHIQVEPSKESAERRRCKRRGQCTGHVTTHKDGTMQRRMWCIFPHQPLR